MLFGKHFALPFALLMVSAGCNSAPSAASPSSKPGAGAALPPVAVQTVTLEARPLVRSVASTGTFESPASTIVASEIAGRLVVLDVPEGKQVAAGHVFARLDASTTRAELAAAAARLENARSTLDRNEAMRGALVSEQQLTESRAAARVAEGEVERVSSMQAKTSVRAPFAGVVGLREVSVGSFVAAGTPITRITQVNPLELVFTLTEAYVPQLATGLTVTGTAAGGAIRYEGKVSAIDPMVDPVTRTVRVQALIENAEGELKPGMSADVVVELGTAADTIAVPISAVLRDGTRTAVYVVDADGVAQARDVELGVWTAREVEVRAGLRAGEIVVAKGLQRLRPGAKVAAQPYQAPENSNLQLGLAGERDANAKAQ